ncbi:MAG TPA: penicillin acylase family protein [Jatrophihabitans sp.]
MPRSRWIALAVAALTTAGLTSVADRSVGAAAPPRASVRASAPSHAYRFHDYADGRAMSIVPPGENGLVNQSDLVRFETTKQRPANSQDQLGKYNQLLYGHNGLADSQLSKYYNDESFGVRPGDIVRTETPQAGVTIYRDKHDIPHVYGSTDPNAAFGAGYAQAEDRLFLMDVLRHYGEGTLASFLGSSCAFEQMDHDQLLLAPYTAKRAVAQVNDLPKEYGTQGALAKSMIYAYVAGVNAYIAATTTNPQLLPADYLAAAQATPATWGVQDVVAIAGLIGGIFGKGGGSEMANAHLLEYLRHQYGTKAGTSDFGQLRTANDPLAPTTATKAFPYEIPGKIRESARALPDYKKAVTGGPVDTAQGCSASAPNPTALSIINGLNAMPKHMSNALLVTANHTAAHHPVAVFGPQVSYFAPQILSQLDLHSPHYSAEGASFPGTGVVELGRGEDYAWSATSAGSDVIDTRLEKLCNPGGGRPGVHGTHYLFKGRCRSMVTEHYTETAYPKPGGQGAPTTLDHVIHRTVHGVVQGYTTSHGRPVAVVLQRSTYNHDVDSVIGFLGWGQPRLTHDVNSWMRQASRILYTFNWFYVDNRDIGYYVSGRDPIRAKGVDPSVPQWGTGNAEWRGFLPFDQHVHQVNPSQGYLISWNNKPAPRFAAADDQYGYGQIYRSIMLERQLKRQFRLHGGHVTRANVVDAMETAASQDLDAVTVVPQLLSFVGRHREPAGVRTMLSSLRSWVKAGGHRIKAHANDAQYAHHDAVAIGDQLMPNLIRAIFDRLLAAGGVGAPGSTGGATAVGYRALPMQFVNTPNSGGAHLGSAYDGGYEGYLMSVLEQLRGKHPRDGFRPGLRAHLCRGGLRTCRTAIDAALVTTYNQLVKANGTKRVPSWKQSSASKAAGQSMPRFDAIEFRALGIVGQPAIAWQNRPTFQQVVQFYRHRVR